MAMAREDFYAAVEENVASRLGDDFLIEVKKVVKNNDSKFTAIMIKENNDPIAPTIYLDDFYDLFEKHGSIDLVANKVIEMYKRYKNPDIDVSWFGDFQQVKDKICFNLISLERNREKLTDLVYRQFEDLAVTYFVNVGKMGGVNGTVTVTQKHMEIWGTSEDELYELALKNTPEIFEYSTESMFDFIAKQSGLPKEAFGFAVPEDQQLWIVTNKDKVKGASVMLYPQFVEMMPRADLDYYIIPSSIHELIVCSTKADVTPGYLKMMVKEVNHEVVSPEEVLSDSVYFYDHISKQVMKIA